MFRYYLSFKPIQRAEIINKQPLAQNKVVKPNHAIRLAPPTAPKK